MNLTDPIKSSTHPFFFGSDCSQNSSSSNYSTYTDDDDSEYISISVEETVNQKQMSSEKLQQLAPYYFFSITDKLNLERETALIFSYLKYRYPIDVSNLQVLKCIIAELMINKNCVYKSLKVQEYMYHIGFNHIQKKVELLEIGEVFASGSFGEVRVVENVLNYTTEVFKQAITHPTHRVKKAIRNIRNEYGHLQAIHSKGRIWGIQEAPRKFVSIQDRKISRVGYLGVKYEHDYFTECQNEKPFITHLIVFHQILSALKELSRQQILHRDIKIENFLVRKDTDGMLLVHLADFGLALSISNVQDPTFKPCLNPTFSPAYNNRQDIALEKKFILKGQILEWVELGKKRDVFAIGFALYEALTGGIAPYRNKRKAHGQKRPYLNTTYQAYILNFDIPKPIRSLVQQMLKPCADERPTAEVAFAQFETFIKEFYPDIYQIIQAKILKQYPGSHPLV